MATVTPNFNWPVPTSTDLVKDGATAIEALGDSIDASLVDLKGGTTGQVLSKTSNTDMDFTWVAADDTNAIQNTIVDAKGDLIAATAADTPARLAVGTNGQVLTADSTAATGLTWATPSAGSTNVAGKNGLLNGSMNVWQRGTSITPGGGGYTSDRWKLYDGSGVVVASRQATNDSTNLPFIQYCERISRPIGNTNTTTRYLYQMMESINAVAYAGKTVTLSFYARAGANFSASSGNLIYQVWTGTGTDQELWLSGYTGAATPINTTATLTTTWQRFSATATLASTTTELATSFNFIPTGTAGANDYFEITGVQLEVASSASAYSPNTPTYALELAACQRYFVRQSGAAASQAYTIFGQGLAPSTSNVDGVIVFPVTMRTTPTVSASGAVRAYDGSNWLTNSGVSFIDATEFSGALRLAVSGATQFRPYKIQAQADSSAYVQYSAEL